MSAPRRSWTDEIFALFIEGRLAPLTAREVCRAVDWIAGQCALVEQIDKGEDDERRSRLCDLVAAWSRDIPGDAGSPDPADCYGFC